MCFSWGAGRVNFPPCLCLIVSPPTRFTLRLEVGAGCVWAMGACECMFVCVHSCVGVHHHQKLQGTAASPCPLTQGLAGSH